MLGARPKTLSSPPRTHLLVEGDGTCAWNLQGSPVTPHLSLTGEWAVVLSEFHRWNHRAWTQRGLRDLIVQPHYFKGRKWSRILGDLTCSRGLCGTIVEPRLASSCFDFLPGTLKYVNHFLKIEYAFLWNLCPMDGSHLIPFCTFWAHLRNQLYDTLLTQQFLWTFTHLYGGIVCSLCRGPR